MESFTRRLERLLSQHRRAVAILLTGPDTFVMVTHLPPSGQDRTPVVVLARSVTAGTVLKSDDLKAAWLPFDAFPRQWFPDPGECVGQTLGFGLEMGTVLQPGMLAASPSLAKGWLLVPILTCDNSLKSLTSPGTPITLMLINPGQMITADARVSTIPDKPEGILLNPSGGARPLILVDIPVADDPEASALGQQGKLTMILGNGPQSPWRPIPIGPHDDESQEPGNPGFTIVPVPKKMLWRWWRHPIGQNPPSNGVWGRER